MMHTFKVEKRFLFTVLLLSIIPLIGIGLLLKEVAFKQLSLPTFGFTKQETNPTSQNNTLPIDPNDPNVISNTIIYTFKGTVSKVAESSISLDPSLPEFPVVGNSVKVYKKSTTNKVSDPVKYSEVKKDMVVVLSAMYNLQTKQWYVTQISIQ